MHSNSGCVTEEHCQSLRINSAKEKAEMKRGKNGDKENGNNKDSGKMENEEIF